MSTGVCVFMAVVCEFLMRGTQNFTLDVALLVVGVAGDEDCG